MNKKLIITIIIALLIGVGSYMAIRFAKGYRPDFNQGTIAPTGLLVANSFPNGASVYLNDKLTTATDNTLHLPPGDYLVKIVKDGYLEWNKQLEIKKELVVQTNAELFKNAPDLQSLTLTGAINPLPSPDGTKIAFTIASASANKNNGLWVLSMQQRTNPFAGNLKQIASNSPSYNFTQAKLFWTPDSKQILALFDQANILLDTERLTNVDDFLDVTAQLPILTREWETLLTETKQEQLQKLPPEMQEIATSSASHFYFSPDEEKMLYIASASATIQEDLIPPLLATSTQPEQREIEPNCVYVYDLTEDKNFFIQKTPVTDAESGVDNLSLPLVLRNLQNQYSPFFVKAPQWYPTSRHLILIEENKIKIVEYDGTNKVAVYNGPFAANFVYPWLDGSKLIILTNLNQDIPDISNLYGVGIK